jgi:hypothetical protein
MVPLSKIGDSLLSDVFESKDGPNKPMSLVA